MKYINRLEEENKGLRAMLLAQMEGDNSLIRYLTSPKFFEIGSVNTYDVLARMAETRSAVGDAQIENQIVR